MTIRCLIWIIIGLIWGGILILDAISDNEISKARIVLAEIIIVLMSFSIAFSYN